ncbi:unnamed protein product [Arctia plantaginis]|uniref:Uncharacterized protein n=1 Tax=Arctia plantaginis TaxID=874455 RepID=A0A8S1ALP2_ARCPL|nr:unnamed protein product [Arctia plantaginis]
MKSVIEVSNNFQIKNSITNFKELALDDVANFLNTVHGLEDLFDDGILRNLIAEFGDKRCYCSVNWKSQGAGGFGLLNDVVNDFFSALKALKNGGLNLENLYLMGYSEGALVAELVAQALNESD